MKNLLEPDCETKPTTVLEESKIADLLHKSECDLFKPSVVEINGEILAIIRSCDCK
jgi:sulfur carrier protein ThiS